MSDAPSEAAHSVFQVDIQVVGAKAAAAGIAAVLLGDAAREGGRSRLHHPGFDTVVVLCLAKRTLTELPVSVSNANPIAICNPQFHKIDSHC